MSGLRFRRRVHVAPGITLNLSRSGLSTSFGVRGLHYTVGHGGRRTTVGLPGTGLSYTTYSPSHARRHTSPNTRSVPAASGKQAGSVRELFAEPPPQKIAWGILFTLLVLTAPVGLPLLITGLVQLRDPKWQVRTFVHQASKEPEHALELLQRAYDTDPNNAEALGPLAEWHYLHGDDAAARPLFEAYLQQVPGDLAARTHYANCCLQAGLFDEAIAGFQAVRNQAEITDDSRASINAQLALAIMGARHDAPEALAVLDTVPLQRHTLGPGLQQALVYRAAARYLVGQRARALSDVDRLLAVDPTNQRIVAMKTEMQQGSFALHLPDGSVLQAPSK